MVIEIHDAATGTRREIVDWHAGSPVFADEMEKLPDFPAHSEPVFWLLKPGDLVCDWLNIDAPDNRGLLRMFVNLALYSKLVGICVFLFA